MLFETFRLAVLAIRRNALRSSLTVLGIVIGVAAVIAMVTIGNGTTAKISADLAKLGNNLLFVRPGQFGPGRASVDAKSFNARDVEALRTQIPSLQAVAPVAQTSATVIYGGESRQTTITGSDAGLIVAQDWEIAAGRAFLDSEVRAGRAVCLLGETVRTSLFGDADALGARIRVKNVSCEVIGALAAKGQSSTGMDQDDVVIMPLRAVQRRLIGSSDIATILLSARDGVDTAKVQGDVELLLRERRQIGPGEDDDFTVRDMKELVQTITGTTVVLTALLGAVAAVSLLVGGIGIMNIMLVSVTERTREIGIRLAIGALEGQVLTQFLVEAAVLSLFGGLAGIALGLGLAWLAAQGMRVPFMVDMRIVLVAFGFSALIGIVFGFFPARRAARLDPIEALRHE
ncbi:ABC transporter permease [Propylenella binzhouense]|uniref:FtsX-like permease family protein n=1 Tax=Propylenella binzhouense TaxID=2555902 RepID=A0A964T6I7_9HYPH|nr:ABC transporter permease [Propylenella binzhouense]MYZ49456.1 FtsX-like permease family protein [Propylenella binzhouense]